jgi:transposase
MPQIEEAQANKRHLLFMDAAHFVLQPFLGYLWCFVRVFIRSSSGRQRFNVLAVLDACTHQIISVTNDSYINSDSVCALLTKIRAAFTDGLPITIVLDNARYQHCRRVIDFAAALEIVLLFLPPYSPNLNLIERLWRFVRTTTLSTEYFDTFPAFKAAIQDCLDHSQSTNKQPLQSLLVLKFQTFKNVTY